ncbi:hypothetical protein BX661DRAFT_87246 [Kickxella alabastrina]|uniref:uncharacterized protein n=1 Tax=Kickxella alabastrina TaxID=61397 RepID=UPI0022212A19|nr:uncharacterized protein BX661DRAFT_87246 [Kickxella alabastrina]KAI7832060.1 hypothetical protein BX661DRAFT_87246 [Kickxella alabastrina]
MWQHLQVSDDMADVRDMIADSPACVVVLPQSAASKSTSLDLGTLLNDNVLFTDQTFPTTVAAGANNTAQIKFTTVSGICGTVDRGSVCALGMLPPMEDIMARISASDSPRTTLFDVLDADMLAGSPLVRIRSVAVRQCPLPDGRMVNVIVGSSPLESRLVVDSASGRQAQRRWRRGRVAGGHGAADGRRGRALVRARGRDQPVWRRRAAPAHGVALAECVEKLALETVHLQVFSPPFSDDAAQDQRFASKVAALNLAGITLDHLGLTAKTSDGRRDLARICADTGDLLARMDRVKSPAEKLKLIVDAHRRIVDRMQKAEVGLSADSILPVLIFAMARANPPRFVSNLRFVQRFRTRALMAPQVEYCMTNAVAAVSFVDSVDARTLGLPLSGTSLGSSEAAPRGCRRPCTFCMICWSTTSSAAWALMSSRALPMAARRSLWACTMPPLVSCLTGASSPSARRGARPRTRSSGSRRSKLRACAVR